MFVGRRNDRAAPGLKLNQAVPLQYTHRFAHRSAADVQYFADIFLQQALPRLHQVKRNDPGQPGSDLLGNRHRGIRPVLPAQYRPLDCQHQ